METWLQVLIRSASLFILVLIATRIMGKRNLAGITPFQLISYIVIAVLASFVSSNVILNPVIGFLALGSWVILTIILEYLAIKSKWIHDLVYGKETVLVKHGKVMEQSLLKARMSGEELLRAMRTKNVFSLSDVEFAVLETTGDLSVFLKSDRKPVSALELGIKTAPMAEPQTIILDGNALKEPLATLGLNPAWLDTQLEKLGISLDNVFIGQVSSSGELYVDLFDDSIQQPQSRVKEMLYATLEKSQADLENFSLQTMDEDAKAMYQMNAEKLQDLLNRIKPYLLN